MLSIYNAQYDDYLIQAKRTDLTEEEKKILRQKKEIMTEVYPAINLYAGYADSGALPDSDLETLIVSKLNQLLMNTLIE